MVAKYTPSSAERSMEIELKLALPCAATDDLLLRLARTPPLARRKPHTLQLHNVYYDTPDQRLRQQRIALRIRKVEGNGKPQWLQTLKTAGNSSSALSQRGEWESPVADENLVRAALDGTPWSSLDPDGSLFSALQPCFATTFERTLWTVRQRDGSAVEVALDRGNTVAQDQQAPICELELELLAGPPQALFTLAQKIARTVAVLPSQTSKAARGYQLAQNAHGAPLHAKPPALMKHMPIAEAARELLREMLGQLMGNLATLHHNDDPEAVHQARVGWRRFCSFWRLCKKQFQGDAVPSWAALHPLMVALGRLRDLDVARYNSLPELQADYTQNQVCQVRSWNKLMADLEQAANAQRHTARQLLEDPRTGACLLAMVEWLENPTAAQPAAKPSLPEWACKRIQGLHEKLARAQQGPYTLDGQHRLRILAKRLRYGVEALRGVLPPQQAQQWHTQALQLQSQLGRVRDLAQLAALAEQLQTDPALQAFLQGVVVGMESAFKHDAKQ
jgi:inorganic triphosphatase YgiF